MPQIEARYAIISRHSYQLQRVPVTGTNFTESTHETGKSYTQGGATEAERATAGHMNGTKAASSARCFCFISKICAFFA